MRLAIVLIGGVVGVSTTVRAQDCSGDPGVLLSANDAFPAIGGSFSLTSQTAVGDTVVLLISAGGAPIETPYGTLCVQLPAAIVTYPQFASTVVLPTTIPFDTNLVGISPHFQFFSISPLGGLVRRSNALVVTIDDGNAVPYAIETIAMPSGSNDPALADLNGDGLLDLAVPYSGAPSSRIAFGDGEGSFGAFTLIPGSQGQYSVVPIDVDGDADLDLLTPTASSLRVWENLGPGQFTLASETLLVSATYHPLTAGDFDLDGDVDAAAVDPLSDVARVFLGDGVDTFSLHATISIDNPHGVVATDLNSDGDLDLAISESGSQQGVAILTGGSGAMFGSPSILPTAQTPGMIVTGDVNSDGRADLAVVYPSSSDLSVILNLSASFQFTTLSTGTSPLALTVADFDDDDNSDLAVANNGSVSLGLYRGLGFGVFSGMESYPAGSSPSSVLAGDLDQNGRSDLVSFSVLSSEITLHLNQESVGFDLQQLPVEASPAGLQASALGDLDGDSHVDIVGIDPTNSQLLPYFGDGVGNFSLGNGVAVPGSPVDLLVADFDHDSDLDVLTSSATATMGVMLGTGAGGFSASTTTGHGNGILALGDLDSDGAMDFVSAGKPTGSANFKLQGFLGAGDGTFSPSKTALTIATPTEVSLGDIDLDGHLDCVACFSGVNVIALYASNGAGGFTGAGLVSLGVATHTNALGDLDGDGDLDIISGAASSTTLTPCYGNGLGSFVVAPPIPTWDAASDIALADLDGDQRLDIATVSNTAGTVWIGFAAPGGGFSEQRQFQAVPSPNRVLVGFVNDDAMPDLVASSKQATKSLGILLHR